MLAQLGFPEGQTRLPFGIAVSCLVIKRVPRQRKGIYLLVFRSSHGGHCWALYTLHSSLRAFEIYSFTAFSPRAVPPLSGTATF